MSMTTHLNPNSRLRMIIAISLLLLGMDSGSLPFFFSLTTIKNIYVEILHFVAYILV